MPKLDKKAALEIEKEENILAKIRDLRKEVGRRRGNMRGNPRRKRIRLDEENSEMDNILESMRGERKVRKECVRKRGY